MRSYRFLGLVVVALIVVWTVGASARPKRIDYHPSICQKESVVGGVGGAGGGAGPSLSYSSMGVMVVGAELDVLCPLEHVTDDDDSSAGPVSLTVSVKVPFSPSTASYCDVRTESDTNFISLPTSPSTFPMPSGTATATGPLLLPTTAPGGSPMGMLLFCDLKQNTIIGSIEVFRN